ncbi:MAG: biotin-independent malonate decarboxylase subunit beta [Geothrix sp.]|nr:biotin-independent malonate decarboxylase subunit beta [Geothrix sp.]
MNHSYYEASARERMAALLDAGSFQEFLPPSDRVSSPHLKQLDQPGAFDDGILVGSGRLAGHAVLAAAQEGIFMGGAVGEVHGAKLVGLLERALVTRPEAVLLLLETGGVRLHEANAGLVAVSEVMHAVLAVRTAGIPVIVLDGGQFGCFGGMGIVAALCDAVVMSEEGRLGLSGPEVIEASRGVEEFDSRDRALVWRTVGGKHRYLLGEATRLVEDSLPAFREAALALLDTRPAFGLEALEAEHARLQGRLERFGDCRESIEIWTRLGIEDAQSLPLLETRAFLAQVGERRG